MQPSFLSPIPESRDLDYASDRDGVSQPQADLRYIQRPPGCRKGKMRREGRIMEEREKGRAEKGEGKRGRGLFREGRDNLTL